MKIEIKEKPVLIPHEIKDEHFRLVLPFTVVIDGVPYIIPSGFESDGASTPSKVELPAWGARYGEAAIVHDYLYRTHPEGISRKKADEIFYAIMKYRKCNAIKARVMYLAVRLFGYFAWKK